MADLATDLDALARRLDAAHATGTRIAPPPELLALAPDDAYDVQDRVVCLREERGLHRSGWKLGNTSFVKQQTMGFPSPLFGRLFAEGMADGVAPFDTFIGPRVEPELAFGLRRPLEAAMHRDALLDAIAWVAPAFEITDSRFAAGTRTAIELIVDNTSAAGYVLGPRRALADAPPLASIATTIRRNGAVVYAGSTADVLGDPLNALALLAAHIGRRGLSSAAGDVVLSGAITDAFVVAAGDRIEAVLEGIGTAAARFGVTSEETSG